LLGELDPVARGVLGRDDLDAGVILDALGGGAVQRIGDVGLAGLQCQGPRGGVGNAPHHQSLDTRHAPPVAGIGLQHDLDTGLAADEFVGAGADRLLFEAVVADFGQVLLGHDDPGGGRSGAVESHKVGPWLLQVEAHHQRIDDLDLADVVLQGLRPGALIALEAELDVFGRHRVAVVKLQSGPQFELIGQAVLALLPGLREARSHLLSGVGPDEGVVDRIEHAEGRDLRRSRRRIEPAGRDRHVPSHHRPPRGRRLGGWRRCGRKCQDRGNEQTDQCRTPVPEFERNHQSLPFEPGLTIPWPIRAGTSRHARSRLCSLSSGRSRLRVPEMLARSVDNIIKINALNTI
jgi:hypothetical protein